MLQFRRRFSISIQYSILNSLILLHMHLYFLDIIFITSPHATGYGVDNRGSIHSRGNISLFSTVFQTGSGTHPVGTGGKTAGAWSWSLTSILS
jgi:hypothetical protein